MLSQAALRMAAKFGQRAERRPEDYHPLICHMLDTAAVAEAMWEDSLAEGLRSRIRAGMGNPESDTARGWVAFLAGLHDLGKACPAFQRKDVHVEVRLASFPLGAEVGRGACGHASVSGFRAMVLLGKELGLEPPVSTVFADIMAGHHGWFSSDYVDLTPSEFGERKPDDHAFYEGVRRELVTTLARLLRMDGAVLRQLDPTVGLILGGLVPVADWIASNVTYFPYAPSVESEGLPAYFERAREQARLALRELGWNARPHTLRRPVFSSLFPHLSPRPLQSIAEKVAQERPRIVIIEAPTGEGKTEAALLLTMAGEDPRQGAYFGLPTQATANQLYERTKVFLERTFPGSSTNLQLVHGGVLFDRPTDGLSAIAEDSDGDGKEGTVGGPSVEAASWFLPKKRALLAPWGVGTIDQALLTVLPVKFAPVRMFGLAGKTVVIDEVHAYDTYTTALLERLLEWLGALGCRTVLMSATLPSSRRRLLAEAYARGAGLADTGQGTGNHCAYPAVTWLSADGRSDSMTFPASRPHRLELRHVEDDPGVLAELLQQQVGDGGCAAVVCNTVRRAQSLYLRLRETFGPDVTLLHSQFVAEDRHAKEQAILDELGPPDGATRRPRRRIVIATQVVEQSLDIDFDVMVSDIAPIDLLIQRAGRLHRHDRGARQWPRTLHVVWGSWSDDGPAFPRGSTAIYAEYILLRTWIAIAGRDSIAIPEDLQSLVDFVYDEGVEADDQVPGPLLERWRRSRADWHELTVVQRERGVQACLRPPLGAASVAGLFRDMRDEDDVAELLQGGQAMTRLAEPRVSLVLLPEGELCPSGPSLSPAETKRLLGRSVSLSRREVVEAVTGGRLGERPPVFARTAALRGHVLLRLDSEGRARVPTGEGKYLSLRYSEELGVFFEEEATKDA